jgi:hypothetical protein
MAGGIQIASPKLQRNSSTQTETASTRESCMDARRSRVVEVAIDVAAIDLAAADSVLACNHDQIACPMSDDVGTVKRTQGLVSDNQSLTRKADGTSAAKIFVLDDPSKCCPFLITLLSVNFRSAMSQSDDTMHVLSTNGRIGFMSGPLTKAQRK